MGSDFDAGYQPAGIYGWRKQCLYATVLFILVIVIMNLALTVWILRVLDFSIEGLHMGNIHMTDDGVHIDGEAEIVKTLYTSRIKSATEIPINIESSRAVVIRARNNKNNVTNTVKIVFAKLRGKGMRRHWGVTHSTTMFGFAWLIACMTVELRRQCRQADCKGDRKFEASCDSFEIQDSGGKKRFVVTDKGLRYDIDEVTYSGRVVFNGSVETPNIRGPLKGPLRLQSVSSSIVMDGQSGVLLEAPEGEITMQSSYDISLISDGGIYLNSTNIVLENVVKSLPKSQGHLYNGVYQLCMCEMNGRLFLAPPEGHCAAESDFCNS